VNEAEIYRQQFKMMLDNLQTQLADVPEDEMFKRPGPHLNPVGWNYWHLLRVWDLDLNWMAKGQKPTEDAWHRGSFTEKSGYNPEGKGRNGVGIGVGYSDAEVDELNFSSEILREYQQRLEAETEEYLSNATNEDFSRELQNPSRPGETTTVGQRFQHAVGHSWNHIGELRYAKGLLGRPDATYPGAGD
jgi:hypothetical protein